ncbi:type II secretion system protein GspK [Novosphingobium sp. SG720]|uniref:general secretion pathway protein GspK n=1 Tax=Novosphingobium sp. SG720 TaxID=2586998 RepID=UPI001446C0CE|nr:type II secretion system protein GspK [Novosphingobium sp. SG720]NKJ43609.1 general secretion pathway protein K [Novosphingobium sp. SG720]
MSGRREAGGPERGAALLAVLVLVAIMAVLAALMLDRLGLATRLAANVEAQGAAQSALAEGEARLLVQLGAGLRAGQGHWPVPRGQIAWRVGPGGNCFNVNALVTPQADGTLGPRAAGMLELRALAVSLGTAPDEARSLVEGMAGWIEAAGRPLLAVGELRTVAGMTAARHARLAPWLCALPEAGSSPVALRSLAPGQGRLLAMFAPDLLPVARAEQVIALAPPGGYRDLAGALGPAQGLAPGEVLLDDRWLRARLVATIDSQAWSEEVLVDASQATPQIAARTWGDAADR